MVETPSEMARIMRHHPAQSRQRMSRDQIRYFRCWTLHDGTLAAAAISALFAAAVIGYVAYQLHIVSQFYSNHHQEQNRRDGKAVTVYHDKNGREITVNEYAFILSQAVTEKALCSAALSTATLLLGCCVLLLNAAIQRRRKLFLPWMIAMGLVYCCTTAVILYNCTVYGFGGVNNILLLTWIGLGFVQVHCFRCVFQYYRYLGSPASTTNNTRSQVLDSSVADPSIYAISGSPQVGPMGPPVQLTLTPPSYEEVVNQPRENTKHFFTSEDAPKEKPPDYTP